MVGARHKSGAMLALFVFAAVFELLVSPAAAKSYRITSVNIDASLRRDGSMDVVESRTYDFDGSFSFAYRDFPEGETVAFEGFEISEDGRPFTLADSKEPGTYSVERTGGRIKVTWYYKAKDESRTFDFRYGARNAVVRHEDTAVLYFKFISEEWDLSQYGITLSVRPPEGTSGGEVRAWLHGPLWAEYRIEPAGTIVASCGHLPRHTYLEIRALYPRDVFGSAAEATGSVRAQVMAEEAKWANEANAKREAAIHTSEVRKVRGKRGMYLGIGLGVLGLGLWWWLFKNFHNKPQLPRFMEMTSEIPDKTPPALVSYLLNSRRIGGAALVGTMLDLGRRGILNLREERVEKKSFWGGMKNESEYHWDLDRSSWDAQTAKMPDYENSLIDFIFNDLSKGADSIPLDTIKKKRREFIKFFRTWKKSVEKAGKENTWFDENSIRGGYYSLALGAGLTLLTALLVYLYGPRGAVVGIAGVAVLVLSILIPHRTAEGETRARHWQAVQKYLRKYEFRKTDRQALLNQISDYLVYGVVLGLAPKFYQELAAYIPEGHHASYVPWYVYHGHGSGQFSPEAFGQAFSSMITTTTTAMSSASGTGGGASAGGGGGASSGGGGAG